MVDPSKAWLQQDGGSFSVSLRCYLMMKDLSFKTDKSYWSTKFIDYKRLISISHRILALTQRQAKNGYSRGSS